MDRICNSTWELWNEILQLYSQQPEIFIAYAIGQWIFFRRLYWFQRCKVKDRSNLHINFTCNLQNQKDWIKVSCQLSTFTFQVEVAGILYFLFSASCRLTEHVKKHWASNVAVNPTDWMETMTQEKVQNTSCIYAGPSS